MARLLLGLITLVALGGAAFGEEPEATPRRKPLRPFMRLTAGGGYAVGGSELDAPLAARGFGFSGSLAGGVEAAKNVVLQLDVVGVHLPAGASFWGVGLGITGFVPRLLYLSLSMGIAGGHLEHLDGRSARDATGNYVHGLIGHDWRVSRRLSFGFGVQAVYVSAVSGVHTFEGIATALQLTTAWH